MLHIYTLAWRRSRRRQRPQGGGACQPSANTGLGLTVCEDGNIVGGDTMYTYIQINR